MTGSPTQRLVLGLQPVRELIRRHGPAVKEVVISTSSSPRLDALGRFASDRGAPVRYAPRGELDRLAQGGLHQGAAAVGPPLQLCAVEPLLERPELLAIALDGVVDPQNFGAVIRSAVGLAAAPVIWPESGSAPLSPATFRASAGAIEHATLCRVRSLHGTLSQAADRGVQIVGLDPQADRSLHELDLRLPSIIVIGSEEKGMGRAVRRACTTLARLIHSETVQSLNASVSAGIALHTCLISRIKSNG